MCTKICISLAIRIENSGGEEKAFIKTATSDVERKIKVKFFFLPSFLPPGSRRTSTRWSPNIERIPISHVSNQELKSKL